jgi:hypothetical protein
MRVMSGHFVIFSPIVPIRHKFRFSLCTNISQNWPYIYESWYTFKKITSILHVQIQSKPLSLQHRHKKNTTLGLSSSSSSSRATEIPCSTSDPSVRSIQPFLWQSCCMHTHATALNPVPKQDDASPPVSLQHQPSLREGERERERERHTANTPFDAK